MNLNQLDNIKTELNKEYNDKLNELDKKIQNYLANLGSVHIIENEYTAVKKIITVTFLHTESKEYIKERYIQEEAGNVCCSEDMFYITSSCQIGSKPLYNIIPYILGQYPEAFDFKG